MEMPIAGSLQTAYDCLKAVWNYDDFRPSQRRIIAAVLRGRDVLALLPTGGGKSICFQLPGLVLPGMTVVVSPLISLMQDQVDALRRRRLPAAYLSSTQSASVQGAVWRAVEAGRVKLLYVAPERMGQLVERLAGVPVTRLAIDEAHCISEWGHEFRPHYRTLGRHRRALGDPPTVAVTATATPRTREDIRRVLRLRSPVIVRSSFDRPNLFFAAGRYHDEGARVRRAAALLTKSEGLGIVYVPTRNRTDGVTSVLRHWGFQAWPYHAGLPSRERRALLEQFSQQKIKVMVATNAFGMGIDQPNVRNVIHLGIPTRPEAYYQEAGRAGRDGNPARCWLLWTKGDLELATRMSRGDSDRPNAALDEVRREALQTMKRYVTSWRCRRKVLLDYLGERLATRCSGCDRCTKRSEIFL